jgi:hypothetical protein
MKQPMVLAVTLEDFISMFWEDSSKLADMLWRAETPFRDRDS